MDVAFAENGGGATAPRRGSPPALVSLVSASPANRKRRRTDVKILSELPGAAECDRAGAAGLELSHRWRSGLVDGTDAGAGAAEAEVEAEVRRVLNMLGRLKLATANTDTSCHNANADRGTSEELKLDDLHAKVQLLEARFSHLDAAPAAPPGPPPLAHLLPNELPDYLPPPHVTQHDAGPGFEAGAHRLAQCALDMDHRQAVVVDVGGEAMMTTVGTLCSVRGSRLDKLTRRYLASGARNDGAPLFIDRSPAVIRAVLQWLLAPAEIPLPMGPGFHARFLKEIRFLGLGCMLELDSSRHHRGLARPFGPTPTQSASGGSGSAAGVGPPPPPLQQGHGAGGQQAQHGPGPGAFGDAPASEVTVAAPPMRDPAVSAPPASRMFVLGGYAYSPADDAGMQLSSVHSYDSQTQTWTTQHPQMPMVCHGLAACSLDGRIYVTGGRDQTWTPMNSVFVLEAEGWRQLANLGTARYGHAFCAFEGRLLVMGGHDGATPIASCEQYDAGTDTWAAVSPLREARSDLSAAVVMGTVFTIGGVNSQSCVNSVEVFRQDTRRWQRAAPMPGAREGSSTAVINDRVYVIGGVDEEEQPLDTIHMFNPERNAWEQVIQMLRPMHGTPLRHAVGGCAAINGIIYIAGGFNGDGISRALWAFNPETNMIFEMPHMPWGIERFGVTAV